MAEDYKRLDYSNQLYAVLDSVNKHVNERTEYRADLALYKKPDFWRILDGTYQGDCEDYALTKRKILIDKGYDPAAMSIATCWVETGEYHAVLIVHTTKVDYLLDNRYETIKDWRNVPYKWHLLQVYGREKWKLIKNKV